MIDKKRLQGILKNPANKLIAIDLDGTLCEGEFWGGDEPKVIGTMAAKLIDLYHRGAHIIIYTARQTKYYTQTHAWLIKHQIPFHGIAMQMKPGADLYIDDKALHTEDVI